MLNRHIKKKKHLNFFSILNMASKHAQFILPHFIILRDFTGPLKGHSSVNELSHKLNESTFQSFLAFCNDKQCFVCLEIIKASIFPLFPFHFSQTQKKRPCHKACRGPSTKLTETGMCHPLGEGAENSYAIPQHSNNQCHFERF